MKIAHTGYKVTGITGRMSAKIVDDGDYVEIVLIDGEHEQSFDLEGFRSFIQDLTQVLVMADNVEHCNESDRGVPE